jgi:hypothetical protein
LAVLLIRVLLSVFRAYQATGRLLGMPFGELFGRFFVGRDPTWKTPTYDPAKDIGEYGASALVGVVEILVYSVLFSAGASAIVGGWVTLKTISLYFRWSSDRVLFNLFLAGNALSIVAGWLISGYVCAVT